MANTTLQSGKGCCGKVPTGTVSSSHAHSLQWLQNVHPRTGTSTTWLHGVGLVCLFNREQVACLLLKPPSFTPVQSIRLMMMNKILSKLCARHKVRKHQQSRKTWLTYVSSGILWKALPHVPRSAAMGGFWQNTSVFFWGLGAESTEVFRTSFAPPDPAVECRVDLRWAHSFHSPAGHWMQWQQCRILRRTNWEATLNDFWQCWHTSLHILKYIKHKHLIQS